MNMIALAKQFSDDKKDFTVIDREGDVVLASYKTESGRFAGWEVFKVRKYADREFAFPDKETGEVKKTFSPAHEAVPPASAWGDEGWTIGANSGESKAYAKFMEIALAAGPSPILGIPTGKPRGRARNEFELDLSSIKGEFEFNLVRLMYQDQDEPMLRNRLRAKLDAGEIRVVREVSGGRGKPRKVYEVVK